MSVRNLKFVDETLTLNFVGAFTYTVNAKLKSIGDLVILTIPAFSSTATLSTSLKCTIPSQYAPSSLVSSSNLLLDNVNYMGTILIDDYGNITLCNNGVLTSGFTAGNNAGLQYTTSIIYSLD